MEGVVKDSAGVPIPGGIQETRGCGTEGRGVVMGQDHKVPGIIAIPPI